MINRLLNAARGARAYISLPAAARAERRRDLREGRGPDPGTGAATAAALAWLGRAQDMSASHDGGVARHFSLVTGWAASYPETTGYIVPTVLEHATRTADASLRERGRRMLDWLVSIQLEEGGFQGGTIGATPVVPVTFNTGQILLGLAAGVRQLGEAYRPAMRAAADWLVATQDPDGCWRRHPTPLAARGEKAYETHVAWGLLEAARLDPDRPYAEAALRQVRWALTHQAPNGWFARCCLDDPSQPLTHTIGYVLRGLVEAWRFSGDRAMLAAARRTADGVLGALRGDGYLPGRLDDQWRGTVRWVCLTGAAQIAHCWLQLFEDTDDARYRDAARAANAWVRSTIRVDGREDTRGGVKGSFPIWGTYGQYEYLNWAAKFLIDANTLEAAVIARGT